MSTVDLCSSDPCKNGATCFYNDETTYIVTSGLCEYSVQIQTDSNNSVFENITLTTGGCGDSDNETECIELTIDEGTIIEDGFGGEISFSEFYDLEFEFPEPSSDELPVSLWGEIISLEPYEIEFSNGNVTFTITFPLYEGLIRGGAQYDLYQLSNLDDPYWERVPNSNCENGNNPNLDTLETTVNGFTRMWMGVLSASILQLSEQLIASKNLIQLLDDAFASLPKPHPDWDF